MLCRHRQIVNFYIRKNETDRLEKNGIDGDAATDCIERHKKKKRKEKRTSVQYSITQIDTDKAIDETISLFFFLSFSFFAFEYK
jgi:hypothetical protein